MPKITKECVCGKVFSVYPYRKDTALFCSFLCRDKFRKKNQGGYKCPKGSEAKKGDKNSMFGKTPSLKHRKKISESLKEFYSLHEHKGGASGIKNPNWKGDSVGYDALHDWVRRQLGTPARCDHCQRTDLEYRQYNWANKSGKYKRDVNDWLRLCAKCHNKYDRAKTPYPEPWNKTYFSRSCDICNKFFKIKQHLIGKKKFCSMSCYRKKQRNEKI